VRAKGGVITREPGPVKGGDSAIAVIEDPDGYKFELLERAPSPEPLCKVMLRVGDLYRSIKFYEKVRTNALYAGLWSSHFLCKTLICLCDCLLCRLLVWSCFVNKMIQNPRYLGIIFLLYTLALMSFL